MTQLPLQKRTLALLALLLPLLALFVYVALRSGPLAPVPVILTEVEERSLTPALFGIGTVEGRFTFKLGPTAAGRIKTLRVDIGDRVRTGQVLAEIDPIDLDERIRAQEAAVKRATALVSEAQARRVYAQTQSRRYTELLEFRAASAEQADTKYQELQIADAAFTAAREEYDRARAEYRALTAQRSNLQLTAPVDGLVVSRDVEPGTTVVAGQSVVQLIDPAALWVNVRFDQIRAQGLAPLLPARITLRSRSTEQLPGQVLRIEPLADAVTEEVLAKVVFSHLPTPLPPLGELAEVTVELPALPPGPVLSNAALQHRNGQPGIWQVSDGKLRFVPVTIAAADLDGAVLIRNGLAAGDRVVIYSSRALTPRSRIKVVERLPGVSP